MSIVQRHILLFTHIRVFESLVDLFKSQYKNVYIFVPLFIYKKRITSDTTALPLLLKSL